MQKNLPKFESKHVLLTKRDECLLHLLYDHGMMSLGQVERYVFTKNAWPTILNRIKRLEDSGYLRRVRVARLRHPLHSKNVGVLLKVQPRGIKEMSKIYPEKTFLDVIPDIREAQLDHDLLLVDVVERLKEIHPGNHFIEGRRYVKGRSDIHRVPDSVMINPEKKEAQAIELELTVKSEKRYRQIVLNYRLMQCFEKVLFVTASKTMNQKIQSQIVGYKVQSEGDLDTGKFTFQTLDELFSTEKLSA